MAERKKKLCTCCGQTKYKTEFYRMQNFSDGYDNRCKECRRKYRRALYKATRGKADGLTEIDGRLMEHKGRSTRLYWSEAKTEEFKRLFPVMRNADLAKEFLCSEKLVIKRAREMGLSKKPEFTKLERFKRQIRLQASRYGKGDVSRAYYEGAMAAWKVLEQVAQS